MRGDENEFMRFVGEGHRIGGEFLIILMEMGSFDGDGSGYPFEASPPLSLSLGLPTEGSPLAKAVTGAHQAEIERAEGSR